MIVTVTTSTGTVTCTLNVNISTPVAPVIVTNFDSDCVRFEDSETGMIPAPDDGCFHVCTNSRVKYQVFNPTIGSNFSWNVVGHNGAYPNGAEVFVDWGATGQGLITVTEFTAAQCTISNTKCVKIDESPRPVIQSFPESDCWQLTTTTVCLNQAVLFKGDAVLGNTNSPITSWFWDFGNNVTSSNQNITHSWDQPGVYLVRLTVTNACNCSGSCEVYFNVNDLEGVVIECATPICGGDKAVYTTNAIGCAPFNWSVLNGTILTPQPYPHYIEVLWNNNGLGNGFVCLDNSNSECGDFCGAMTCIEIPIISNIHNISGPQKVCVGTQVRYSIPELTGSYYYWQVSNGNIVNGAGTHEIIVEWASLGAGSVQVDYEHPFLGCRGVDDIHVDIQEPYTINGPDKICTKSSVQFSVPGVNTGSFTWFANLNGIITNLGTTVNSGMLSIPSWSHGTGNFTIEAHENTGVFCNSKASFLLTVLKSPYYPAKPSGPELVCPGYPYLYNGTPGTSGNYLIWQTLPSNLTTPNEPLIANGNQVSISWGEQLSSGQNYAVQIKEVDPTTGCASAWSQALNVYERVFVAPQIVENTNPIVSPPFTHCINSVKDYKINNILAFQFDHITWEIDPPGAGSVIAGQGTPNISIQWNNTPNSSVLIRVKTVLCGNNKPDEVALVSLVSGLPISITPQNSAECEGTPVLFGVVGNPPGIYSWDFGDGSIGQYPPHNYALLNPSPATYNVTVSVSNNGCTSTASTQVTINPQPTAIISSSGSYICPSLGFNSVIITANPNTTGYSYSWQPGGATTQQITVTSDGVYNVTVLNSYGCTATGSAIIGTCPTPPGTCVPNDPNISGLSFTVAQQSNSNTYTFTPTINCAANCSIIGYTWIYGNGVTETIAGPLQPITFTYSQANLYTACLEVITWYNGVTYCTSVCMPTAGCVAKFDSYISCNSTGGYDVHFVNQSQIFTGTLSSVWSGFGSGSTDTNPIWQNATAGTHNITLVISDGTGSTCTTSKSITVLPAPDPVFSVSAGPYCQKQTVLQFTINNPSPATVSALWNFDDNSSYVPIIPTTNFNAEKVYAGNQFYFPTLILKDIYGCIYTASSSLQVELNNLNGNIDPPSTTNCPGISSLLTFNPIGSINTITSYLWTTGATTASLSVNQTGAYNVTVTDNKGCNFTPLSPGLTTVINVPEPKINGKLNICDGEDFVLNGLAGNAGAYQYNWNVTPAMAFSNPTDWEFIAQAPALGVYTIELTITYASCTRTSQVTVTVNAMPPLPVISSNPVNACAGDLIALTADNYDPAFWINWNTGAAASSISTYSAGLYEATFTDQNGCRSSSHKIVHPQPYLGFLMQGCLSFCDTTDITIPGSGTYLQPGLNINLYDDVKWTWYVDGQIRDNGTGDVNDLNLGPLSPQFYTVQLELTILYGDGTECTVLSDLIEISTYSCPCGWDPVSELYCMNLQNDITPLSFYHFILDIPYSCGNNNPMVTITSPDGGVTILPTSTSPTRFEGVLSTLKSHPDEFCFKIDFNDPVKPECNCIRDYCITLPPCEPVNDCYLDYEIESVSCNGFDAAGNPVYEVQLNYSGGGPWYITLGSPTGILSPNGYPLPANQNFNLVNFTLLPPFPRNNCILLTAYNFDTHELCVDNSICMDYPSCFNRNASSGYFQENNGLQSGRDSKLDLLLYPNPAAGILNLKWNLVDLKVNIEIRDISKRLNYSSSVSDKETFSGIDIGDWPEGMYFVTLRTSTGISITRKFIVIK